MCTPVPVEFRSADRSDLPLLRQMLFEAAYWRSDQPRPSLTEGLSRPDLQKLLANWGRPGDTGVIALNRNKSVGAAWYRFWTEEDYSYGFVEPAVPELAIGVMPAYRRKGIGRGLLEALIHEARESNRCGISLSVEQDNPAHLLYRSMGFREVKVVGNSWTMLLKLNSGRD